MNELQRLNELDDLRKLHLHQLQNKAMAPFCAATKEQYEMATCHNCGQFRACALVNNERYCKAKCEAQAKRGTTSNKRPGDIAPRRGGR